MLQNFIDHKDKLHNYYFACKADERVRSLCDCGQAAHTVTCHDCHKYPVTCEACYAWNHRFNPFHWPLVWSQERGFFKRIDISRLHEGKYAINTVECEGACHGMKPSDDQPPSLPPSMFAHSNTSSAADSTSSTPKPCKNNSALFFTVEETLCTQARNATVLKTLITPTPNTTHTNPQVHGGF